MFSLQSVAKLLATGDWKKAERQLKVLRRRYPERADVAYNYALVVRERGRFDEALEMLAETARRFPDYPRASFEHANTLVALGCEPEAVERLERPMAGRRRRAPAPRPDPGARGKHRSGEAAPRRGRAPGRGQRS